MRIPCYNDTMKKKKQKQTHKKFKNFKRIHIRTEADMDKLWKKYGTDIYRLGDLGIILVEH